MGTKTAEGHCLLVTVALQDVLFRAMAVFFALSIRKVLKVAIGRNNLGESDVCDLCLCQRQAIRFFLVVLLEYLSGIYLTDVLDLRTVSLGAGVFSYFVRWRVAVFLL